VSATKQVRMSLALGQQYVQIMDAALTKMLRDDAARLAEWKHAHRVVSKGTSSVEIVTAAPPTMPSAGATATETRAA
jgi:hypothetical protein